MHMKKVLIALMLFLVAFAAIPADAKPYTRNVAVVVYKNAEPLDWTGPFEVWNDAASFGESNGEEAFHVYVVSKTTEPLNAQGLQVVPNYSIANAPKPDVLIIPGGQSSNLTNDPEFFAWTEKAAEEAEIVQTVCTGALVLAKAGMLDNLEVTTWYGAIRYLRDSYPKVTVKDGRRFIDNGRIVTTAGISAGIDGSLHLVARLLGRRVADQVARYMEYHWTPEPYLAVNYRFLNPSTDDQGRLMQSAEMQREEKNFQAAADIYRSILEKSPDAGAAWFALARTLRDLDDHPGAAAAYVRAANNAQDEHHKAHALYNAACEYTLAGSIDEAVASLQKAVASGFVDSDQISHDPDLARLRTDKRVQGLFAAK
jgi:transcriptional regulator GlxA family with amidase domain